MKHGVLLILLLIAPEAEAVCAAACSCNADAQWFAWGKVDATGRFTSSTVVVRDGFTSTPQLPTSVEKALSGDVVIDSSGLARRASGSATVCNNVTVPAQDWAAANFGGTCDALLVERGFIVPPCNDTRGCSAAGTGPLLFASLAALAARRRFRGTPSPGRVDQRRRRL